MKKSILVTAAILLSLAGSLNAQQPATAPGVKVQDGIVLPRQPLKKSIADAMLFLKKADGSYVPGQKRDWATATHDQLAGYFTSAWVLEDGSRAPRKQAFPGRQHAYFIQTFLRYHKYTGEEEWLLRARDLAEWNLAHSTPPDAFYANLPYSTYTDGKPGGSAGQDSTEVDKAAFIGSAYIALYEVTKEKKYLEGAKAIGNTLAHRQNPDGSWPFRALPGTGEVREALGGAPVFFVELFENLLRHEKSDLYRAAHDKTLKLMIERNVEKNLWGIYHEDVRKKRDDALSAESASFTAIYLFRKAKQDPNYLEMGRRVLSRLEARLVHTEGHSAAPAPAVSEQEGFEHMMPGHTARYCLALVELHNATGDPEAKKKATSGFNALTYMQSPAGLFRTHFQLVKEKKPNVKRPNWYSQHLYTVCHVLEAMPFLRAEF
jgi:hypothetical protein